MLAVDAGKIVRVLGHHLQQIVCGPRHQVAFQHIRHPLYRRLERLEHLVRLPRQRDLDEDGRRSPQLARIQQRDILADDPLLLEPLHPAVAGRRREVGAFGQFGIRHPPILLQGVQDTAVCPVNFHIMRKNLRCLADVFEDSTKSASPGHVLFKALPGRPVILVQSVFSGRKHHEDRLPQRDQAAGIPRRHHPQRRARGREPWPYRDDRNQCRHWAPGFTDADYVAAGAKIVANGGRGLRQPPT